MDAGKVASMRLVLSLEDRTGLRGSAPEGKRRVPRTSLGAAGNQLRHHWGAGCTKAPGWARPAGPQSWLALLYHLPRQLWRRWPVTSRSQSRVCARPWAAGSLRRPQGLPNRQPWTPLGQTCLPVPAPRGARSTGRLVQTCCVVFGRWATTGWAHRRYRTGWPGGTNLSGNGSAQICRWQSAWTHRGASWTLSSRCRACHCPRHPGKPACRSTRTRQTGPRYTPAFCCRLNLLARSAPFV